MEEIVNHIHPATLMASIVLIVMAILWTLVELIYDKVRIMRAIAKAALIENTHPGYFVYLRGSLRDKYEYWPPGGELFKSGIDEALTRIMHRPVKSA